MSQLFVVTNSEDQVVGIFSSLESMRVCVVETRDPLFQLDSYHRYKVPIVSEFNQAILEQCYEYAPKPYTYSVYEFYFPPGKEIALMQTTGPSSECCEWYPITSREFWIQTLTTTLNDIQASYEVGEQPCITNIDHEEYSQTTVGYCAGRELSPMDDMMQFILYSNICPLDQRPILDP